MTYDIIVDVYVSVFVCMILVMILLCLFVFVGMSFGALPEAVSEEACEWLRSCSATCCQMETHGVFMILDTTEASLIWWWILVSSGGHTRIDETSRLYTTSACTPVRSWLAKTRCAFTCLSGFLGSTTIIGPFLDLLRRLGLLSQGMWLWLFKILWSMSLPRRRGVDRQGRGSHGSMRSVTP